MVHMDLNETNLKYSSLNFCILGSVNGSRSLCRRKL